MKEDMVILSRTFDLLQWLLPKTERFPRIYRHSVTQRMMDSALDFQESLFTAQMQRGKTRYANLLQCDAYLNKLRLYLRIAHHWHWVNDGQYEHVSRMVAELGKLLGGWLKQTQRSKSHEETGITG